MALIVPTQEVAPGELNTGSVVQTELPQIDTRQTVNAANDIALLQQRQRNADRLFQAETALTDEYREYERIQQDRRGQEAWGVTDDAAQWWSEVVPRMMDELENDAQRTLFKETAGKMRNTSLNAFSSFESTQRRASLEESGQSAILSAIDFGAANHGSEDALIGARRDIIDRVGALADLNGWSPERKDAALAESLTKLHEQVIQNKVDNDPAGAREYFEKHKLEIRGSAHDVLNKTMEESDVRAVSQQGADAIYDPEKTESAALAEARKRYTGKERDEVVRRLKVRYAEDEAIKLQEERDATDAAWEIFSRTGTTSSIPPSIYSKMDPKIALSMRAQEFNPSDMISTNWEVYQSLADMAVVSPAEFVKTDLRAYYDQLNVRERDYLTTLQNKIVDDGEAGIGGLPAQLTQAARMMGWTAKDAEDRGLFERQVRQELGALQRKKGQEATYEQRQQIIDRMLVSGEVIGGGGFGLWDPNKRYYEVVGTEAEDAFRVEVPDSERAKIEKALEANGVPVTDENIRNLYRAQLGM